MADYVSTPAHYMWVGKAIVANGGPKWTADLQSWDLLDALFPDNPHLWNVGKYLTRFGRKGDASKRLEDLRKAATYLQKAIKAEERHVDWRATGASTHHACGHASHGRRRNGL